MSVSAEVQKFERGESGHIEYFIKVIYKGKVWAIRKRYRDFAVLDSALRKNSLIDKDIKFPKKNWWAKRHDVDRLSKRAKELQAYLHQLLNSSVTTENSLMKEFLEVDLNNLEMAKKMTSFQMQRNEQLQLVIDTFHICLLANPKMKGSSRSCQYQISSRNKLNRSRSTTSVSLSSSSISSRSRCISKDCPQREIGNSFDCSYPISPSRPSTSLKAAPGFSKLGSFFIGNPEHGLVSDAKLSFLHRVESLWNDYEDDIFRVLDSVESIVGCSQPCHREDSSCLPNTDRSNNTDSASVAEVLVAPSKVPSHIRWNQLLDPFVLESHFGAVLEGNRPLLKDMQTSHFEWSAATRRERLPADSLYSKIISIPTSLPGPLPLIPSAALKSSLVTSSSSTPLSSFDRFGAVGEKTG